LRYLLRRDSTSAGRKIAGELAEYRNFLGEVDADAISRVNSSDHAPRDFNQKDAYALAFHLDLGWGEQLDAPTILPAKSLSVRLLICASRSWSRLFLGNEVFQIRELIRIKVIVSR
jgi:hypothetical protein